MVFMIARTNYSSAQTVADRGEHIYKDRFQSTYEKEYGGQYVVIDILTKQAYVAPSPEEATDRAKAAAPGGLFHVIRIEASAALKLPAKFYSIDSFS
jgi:hypothetical protein